MRGSSPCGPPHSRTGSAPDGFRVTGSSSHVEPAAVMLRDHREVVRIGAQFGLWVELAPLKSHQSSESRAERAIRESMWSVDLQADTAGAGSSTSEMAQRAIASGLVPHGPCRIGAWPRTCLAFRAQRSFAPGVGDSSTGGAIPLLGVAEPVVDWRQLRALRRGAVFGC